MRKKIPSAALAFVGLLALLCPAVPAPAKEKVELRLDLKKGETYRLKVTIDQKIEQRTPAAGRQVTRQTTGFTYSMAVWDVADDGVMDLKVIYDSVLFRQEAPGGAVVEYDSARPPDAVPPAALGLAALVGQGFTMKISPTGKVSDLKGVDEMLQAILKKLDLPPGPAKDAAEKAMKKMLNSESLRQSMEQMTAIYPADPVTVGEKWKLGFKMSVGIPLSMENTYVLKRVREGKVELGVESKVSTDPDAPPLDLGQATVEYDLKGEQSGTFELDRASGQVRSGDIDQTISGTMKIRVGQGPPTNVPLFITTHLTLEPAK